MNINKELLIINPSQSFIIIVMKRIKKGSRILGIAESFSREKGKSILVGIVYRIDGIIDGFTFVETTLGGMDSTDRIIELYNELGREDINFILISGVVISLYNVIDLHRIHYTLKLPVISITYEESEGLTEIFIRKFPRDWHHRLLIYYKNGDRSRIKLSNGYIIYIRSIGLEIDDAKRLLDKITFEGKYPEPIRIARLVAKRLREKLH